MYFKPLYLLLTLLSFSLFSCSTSSDPVTEPDAESEVITLAGNASEEGDVDGQGFTARFKTITGLCTDKSGNVFVSDMDAYKIKKITPSGVVTTFVGSDYGYVDGPASTAKLKRAVGICIDNEDNLYVADLSASAIRKITPTGIVSTLAGGAGYGSQDGQGSAATFYWPCGICFAPDGNLYVIDQFTNLVRRVSLDGMVTTLAGRNVPNGFGAATGIAALPNNELVVANYLGHNIKLVSRSGEISTLSGGVQGFNDGNISTALFDSPFGVATASNDDILIADGGNGRLRLIRNKQVTTLLGDSALVSIDGPIAEARMIYSNSVCFDKEGNIYFNDGASVRKIKRK